jgi:NAD(P)H-nitrite reductase large subunit
MLDQVMATMLDAETSLHRSRPDAERVVDVRLNTRAAEIVGNGKARGVQLETGEALQADLIIAATGVKPNLDLLEGSSIAHQWGILVNANLQTNHPDIFAAGDCLETPNRLTGARMVHAIFPNAIQQGHVVGMNLAGNPIEYDGAERMNSLKHLGLPIMAAGEKQGDCVLRERKNGTLRTIYFKGSQLVGFQLVGDIRAAGIFHALMVQQCDISSLQPRLLDPNFGEGMHVWEALSALT